MLKAILPPEADGSQQEDSFPLVGGLNTTQEKILSHVKHNIRLQLPQIKQFQAQEVGLIIAAGGPSLKSNLKNLRRQYNRGSKLVTVNGTHDYMLDNGFKPSMHIMVDARPWNVRFVQRPISTCKYIVASQCHPSVFEALKDNETYIYHTSGHDGPAEEELNKYYFKKFIRVVGGSTVVLNSFMLLRTLGFKYFDVYGFDSCYLGKKHHSYPQPENGKEAVVPVEFKFKVNGKDETVVEKPKKFFCASWMVRQAYDFQGLVRAIKPGLFKCRVHGPGLISYMMRTGSTIENEKEN